MAATYIYQIYYDAQTKNTLDPGFIPLDNSLNERPDWYEFWPILNHLKTHALDENSWYGFLSPKFGEKTSISSSQLNQLMQQTDPHDDVALVHSYYFEQIAYFKNPFEQGEYWHPGITETSQKILDELGYGININDLVTHSQNFAFSNYIIAKPRYWRAWLEMANRLFNQIEYGGGESEDATLLAKQDTTYSTSRGMRHAPMKTFIQERIPCLLGALHKFNYLSFENTQSFPLMNFFVENKYLRALLQTCNILKINYVATGEDDYLKAYHCTRRLITPRQMQP